VNFLKSLQRNALNVLKKIPGFDQDRYLKQKRTQEVYQQWIELVDPLIVKHTNGVYLFTKEQRKEFHVYVDESIFASELNARRELLRLQFEEKFHESIDEFYIHISHGKKKNLHPLLPLISTEHISAEPQPLSLDESAYVDDVCATITDPSLRKHFKKAMISNLEWKKGEERKK
jgi:hypothetical protein